MSYQVFTISFFNNKTDNKAKEKQITWLDFLSRAKSPLVRNNKDGEAFSPCIFQNGLRKKENVPELCMLIFDIDTGIELDALCEKLRKLKCAFVVYSTHSHKRQTDKNPDAESRWRICIPLAANVLSSEFLRLWQAVNQLLDLQADENAKDVSRLHYKPVKASVTAPYEFYIEDRENFFAWNEWLEQNEQLSNPETNPKQKRQTQTFKYHENRHAELVQSIIARGKLNSHGNYDAKGICHNGKGESGLGYFPESGKVFCKNDPACSYDRILEAEGLPSGDLPKKQKANQQKEEKLLLSVVCMETVKAIDVVWLWFPYIAKGKITIIEGVEGLGKSWLTCAFACAVTTGAGFPPNFEPIEPGNVLLLSAEDGLADTIKPRLVAVGANCERVYAIAEPFTLEERGIIALCEAIATYKPALVIIDPLFAYTGAKIDINKVNESRAISVKLAEIAEKFDCALVLIRHIGKAKGCGDARAAGLGSIDWRAAARSVLLVGMNPHKENERAIVQTKNNLEQFGKAIGFIIENSQFRWLKESNITAEQILAKVEGENEKEERNAAIVFLRKTLANGEKEGEEVKREAEILNISPKQLRTARNRLEVNVRFEGFGKDKKSYWSLSSINAHDEINKANNAHENNKGIIGTYEESRANMDSDNEEREAAFV